MTGKVHLLVLCHGMWGNKEHLDVAAETISSRYPPGFHLDGGEVELQVLNAQTNQASHTYDGIDWGGERVVAEIRERIASIEEHGTGHVVKFSITGYSLGGLLARYVVGALYASGFFNTIEPVNFNTVATPHLGIPRYPTFWSGVFAALGPRLLSRTGEQFYGADKWDGNSGSPLLEVMSHPDSVFYKGLCLFPNVTLYANSINDTTVPYITAAVETQDPFLSRSSNGLEIELDEEYPPLLQSFQLPATPPAPPPQPPKLSLAYLRSFKAPRIFIPPPLQARFPLNLVVYAVLPFLIPVLILLVLARLSLDSRASRARIRLLESDSSKTEYLRALFRGLEKSVDNAVADYIDRPTPTDLEATSDGAAEVNNLPSSGDALPTQSNDNKGQPRLTPSQLRMAKSLNSIPQLKKKLAYIEGVMNSHAVIVARDVKSFPFHETGRGVLRHWADTFIL